MSNINNNYFPNRTTQIAGDSVRNPTDLQSKALGSMQNFMKYRYSVTTGYTPQKYASGNEITPQTLYISSMNNQVTKLTSQSDSLSNSNIKGLTTSRLK